jgi:hypothetical protein
MQRCQILASGNLPTDNPPSSLVFFGQPRTVGFLQDPIQRRGEKRVAQHRLAFHRRTFGLGALKPLAGAVTSATVTIGLAGLGFNIRRIPGSGV